MTLLLSDKKIKQIKSENTIEHLVSLIEAQQKKQDEAILAGISLLEKTLQSIKDIGVKDKKDFSELESYLKKTQTILQNHFNQTTDHRSIVAALTELSKKLDQKDLVNSINALNKTIETKPKEWKFTVARDSLGRIDSIKAISETK